MDGTYLASKDDNLVDRSCSLLPQELADDVAAQLAGSYNSEVLVSGHVSMLMVVCDKEAIPCFASPLFMLLSKN